MIYSTKNGKFKEGGQEHQGERQSKKKIRHFSNDCPGNW